MKRINSIKRIEHYEGYERLYCIDQSMQELNETSTFKDKQFQALEVYLPKFCPEKQITIGAISTGNTAYSLVIFAEKYNAKHGKKIKPVIFIPHDLENRPYFGPDINGTIIPTSEYVKVIEEKAELCDGKIVKLNFGVPGEKSEKDYLHSLRLAESAYSLGLVKDLFINITEGLENTSFLSKEQIKNYLIGKFSIEQYNSLPKLGIKAYQPIISKGLEDLKRLYNVQPDFIICQFGAGILYNEIVDYIKHKRLSAKVIPIAVGSPSSCADKIYASYWAKDPEKLTNYGKTKSKHDDSTIYGVEDWEIGKALCEFKGQLNAEASGIAGLSLLHRIEKITPELNKKKHVVLTINTGNGLPNFKEPTEKEDYEDSESKFISANLILKRIGLKPKNTSKKINYRKNVLKTIRNIEKIEENWRYIPLNESHIYGRKEKGEKIGFWSVPKMSAKVLSYLILHTNSKNILEIGTSAGYSTIHLANATNQIGGKVSTIENLNKKSEIAKNNFKYSGLNNINLIENEASQTLSNWEGEKLDFVFLDADKENYGKYLELLLPIMKVGGLIVADNINDYGHMMEDYLQKVAGTHLPRSRCDRRVKSTYLAQLDNGLLITKKISE